MRRKKQAVAIDVETGEVEENLSELVEPSEHETRVEALRAIAGKFSMWRPARQELVKVRSIKTCFPQFDRGTRTGGLPIERVHLVHGPSNHGKSLFTNGLGFSFLQGGHFFAKIDAEMTDTIDWMEQLMGQYADHPGFLALRPGTYEEAIDAVRQWANVIAEARAKGDIHRDTTGVCVVDSIRKLVPKHLMDKIRKEGADGLGGRANQLKAAMNQAWLDELTPLLYKTKTTVVIIARESDRTDASDSDRKYDNAWQIGGGKGVVYDSSLAIRVKRAKWIKEGFEESAKVVGERFRARIWKTKVEGKDGAHTDCYFHTANGSQPGIPAGFDRARDLFEMAVAYQVIEQRGAWFSYNGMRLGQGEAKALAFLHEHADYLEHLEGSVRAEFRPDEVLPSGEED